MQESDRPLDEYRRKRSAERTPEPVPSPGPLPRGNDDTFVVHEHHARRLHWDLRLERGGVLVSWAVPKGLPPDPKINHLAVRTEDHPIDYAGFEGEIPKGEYGAGRVLIWDRGRYETEKWSDREVKFVLHGSRVSGRYVLFRTRDKDWMIHRMDPPPDPDWRPLPERVAPMLPVDRRALPRDQALYGFEFAWDGLRAVAHVAGGRLRLLDREGADITERYPELRPLGGTLGTRQVVLDGELVALDARRRPSPELLSRRAHAENPSQIRKLRRDVPVTYLLFDVLHLDGRPLLDLGYRDRRAVLDGLELAGPHWQTAPWFDGDGAAVVTAAREQGLPGVVAKRLDAPYRPGGRSTAWLRVASRTPRG
ncbi:MAG: DNA ligase [Streptosporangiales bacterium]|nr:DNA ligase [Streptosporangiales bacterium]